MTRIIEALDTPTSQVPLEIKIMQLTLGDGFESFFNFNLEETGKAGALGDLVTNLGLGGTTVLASSTVDFLFDTEKIDARIRYFSIAGTGGDRRHSFSHGGQQQQGGVLCGG